jgi:hypothetical protein
MLFETLEKRLLLSADPLSASQQLQEDKLFINSPIPAAEVEQLSNEALNNVSDSDNVKAGISSSEAEIFAGNKDENRSISEGIPPLEGTEAISASYSPAFSKENISVQLSYLLSEDSGRQLVIIDPSVPEYEALINRIFEDNPGGKESSDIKADDSSKTSFEIIILDPDKDGIEQITETLGQYQDIEAVHIISHGASGICVLRKQHC